MPINPAIALGVQPLQLADPLSQYAKFASIQQAQNQNALAQYQLDAARREQASQNALNEAYRAAYNPQTGAIDMNRLRQTLSTGGFGSKLPGIEKSMAEVETKRAQEAKAKTDLVDAKLKQSRGFLDTIDPADPTAPEKFIAWHEANHRDPVLGPVLAARGITADQSRARIAQAIQQGPQAFTQLLMQAKLGTEKFMEMNKPMTVAPGASVYQPGATEAMFTAPPAPAAPTRLQDRFVPVGKLVFDRQEQRWVTPPQAAIAATQDRAAPAAPAAPAPKPLTAQQETQRRDKLGKEFKAATNALQTTQDVLDSIQMVRDAPGLNRATGFTGVYTPSFSEGAAAQAETRFQNLKGKITALGKAQAAASGAIGSIANQEWKILADQIAALELVKGTGPLLEQLTLVEAQAQGAMERIRDAYQRQFGEDFERFPQFRDIPQPKSTVKGRKSSGAVTPAAPATGAFPAPPPAAIDALKRGQGTDEQFDAVFGPGAAARARGR